jgi:serine/threonine protein phosphatase PrpC
MLVVADGKRPGSEPCGHKATVEVGCNTQIGFGRQINEDAFWLASDTFDRGQTARLMAVADGMGGHKGGGVASRFVCEAL